MLVNGKCAQCEHEGKKSNVFFGMKTTTLLGYTPKYYNQDGELVTNKDPNTHTQEYYCSNGHRFAKKWQEATNKEWWV
jgi:hypothetical protein